MAAREITRAFNSLNTDLEIKKVVELALVNAIEGVKEQIWKKFRDKQSLNENKHMQFLRKTEGVVSQKADWLKQKNQAEENRVFTMKLINEQSQRKFREEERRLKQMEKEEKMIKQQEVIKELNTRKNEEKKRKHIGGLQEKSKERKEMLLKLKKFANRPKKYASSTPLYKRLEIDYMLNTELPELKRRNELLLNKKIFFKPIDHSLIKQHALNFDISHSAPKAQRNKSFISFSKPLKKSQFFRLLLIEEKAKASSEQEKINRAKLLLSKKRIYAELVKEVHLPTIDMFKKKEMEMIKARLSNPVAVRVFSTPEPEKGKKINHRSSSFSLNRVKKNTINSQELLKKKPVIRDYIKEFRDAHLNFNRKKNNPEDWKKFLAQNLSFDEKRKKIKEKADFLEREAIRNEVILGSINPLNVKSVEVSEAVSELLVNSIKAKLAILNDELLT